MIVGLDIFINSIVGYIELRENHAPVIGRLDVSINSIMGYIELGGLHAPVIGE
jgi:hypothetical protein